MDSRLKQAYDTDTEAIKLLREWLCWWDENAEAPAKMPNALHVKTAVFLIIEEHERRGH